MNLSINMTGSPPSRSSSPSPSSPSSSSSSTLSHSPLDTELFRARATFGSTRGEVILTPREVRFEANLSTPKKLTSDQKGKMTGPEQKRKAMTDPVRISCTWATITAVEPFNITVLFAPVPAVRIATVNGYVTDSDPMNQNGFISDTNLSKDHLTGGIPSRPQTPSLPHPRHLSPKPVKSSSSHKLSSDLVLVFPSDRSRQLFLFTCQDLFASFCVSRDLQDNRPLYLAACRTVISQALSDLPPQPVKGQRGKMSSGDLSNTHSLIHSLIHSRIHSLIHSQISFNFLNFLA